MLALCMPNSTTALQISQIFTSFTVCNLALESFKGIVHTDPPHSYLEIRSTSAPLTNINRVAQLFTIIYSHLALYDIIVV